MLPSLRSFEGLSIPLKRFDSAGHEWQRRCVARKEDDMIVWSFSPITLVVTKCLLKQHHKDKNYFDLFACRRVNNVFANQYGISGLLEGLITPNYSCMVVCSGCMLVCLDVFHTSSGCQANRCSVAKWKGMTLIYLEVICVFIHLSYVCTWQNSLNVSSVNI